MKVLKGITAGVLCLTLISEPGMNLSFTGEISHAEASTQTKAMFANVKTNVYVNRSTKSKRVIKIPYGARVERLSVQASWSEVRYNGKKGWVASRDLVEIRKTEVLDTKQTVTMYASRSTKAKAITSIPANKQVTRLAINKSWSQVKYGNHTGWVANSQLKLRYTSETFAPRAYQLKEDAPLQNTYTTNGKMLVSIPKQTIVSSSERYNGWYKVTFNGKTGWVNGKYLVAYTPVSSTVDPIDVAKKIYGSDYKITGSGYSITIDGQNQYTGMGPKVLVIEMGDREDYARAARLITELHGGNASTLAEYMWSARPGQRYWSGVNLGKYEISADASGGVVVVW
ncbi:SH3 domain-containing protein [Exiguobacterium sp. AB2]|uniref:SH3 domain-containing protein n=1 Tax=Exiguobacterium sp. AB2 TaxID=1484479 RepID=UPI0004A8FE98|nr:SH3 domain-containing protein [Exiguobacterium sp. AB2]KDN57626.1 hypothetical protein DI14_10485 [Exiguobacterium sp. AB2]